MNLCSVSFLIPSHMKNVPPAAFEPSAVIKFKMSFTFDVFLSVMNEIEVFVFIYVFYYWQHSYGEHTFKSLLWRSESTEAGEHVRL